MTIKSTLNSAALTAALLLPGALLLPAVALPTGAFAQTQTPVGAGDSQSAAPSGSATAPRAPHMAKAPAAKPVSRAERVEQHIKQLHTQLRITPAQQTQWDQFAQVMRDNAKDMDQALDRRGTGFAAMNAADNLQSYAQVAQQHAQDTQRLATTFQTLYGSMSDDQKKNADAVFQARADRGRHKHG
jgi:protein CpxP